MPATITGTGISLNDTGVSKFPIRGTNLQSDTVVRLKDGGGTLKFLGSLENVTGGTSATAVVFSTTFMQAVAFGRLRFLLESLNITVQNPGEAESAPLPVDVVLLVASEG